MRIRLNEVDIFVASFSGKVYFRAKDGSFWYELDKNNARVVSYKDKINRLEEEYQQLERTKIK